MICKPLYEKKLYSLTCFVIALHRDCIKKYLLPKRIVLVHNIKQIVIIGNLVTPNTPKDLESFECKENLLLLQFRQFTMYYYMY